MQKLIIGISGSSGVIYGIRLLEVLRDQPDVQTHLVLSATGKLNIAIETEFVTTHPPPSPATFSRTHNRKDVRRQEVRPAV